MKKIFKIGGLAVLAMFLIFGATIGFQVWSGIRETQAIAAQDIVAPDLAQVPDGIWQGEVEWGVLVVEVEVTVQSGKITNIQLLKHEHGMGEKGEKIVADILAAQSIEVDAISGATLSSRAITKAVANALSNSQ